MNRPNLAIWTALWTCALIASPRTSTPARAAGFRGLGDLPGGPDSSMAMEVSADGTTVVGAGAVNEAGADAPRAFRWTSTDGMMPLGDPPTTPWPINAHGVNADGSVVVGRAGMHAYRWTSAGGLVSLGALYGLSFGESYARAVSGDGSVVGGDTGNSLGAGPADAFRWTATDGMLPLPRVGGGDNRTVAFDVSADGSVIVGRSGSIAPSGEAFVWTATGGTVGLGDLPTGSLTETHFDFDSQANAASSDGSVVVGYGTAGYSTFGAGARRAMRWTAVTGMVQLLPGAGYTRTGTTAWDVSADGSVIVGDGVGSLNDAFVWTADTGIRSLASILTEAGVDLTGWELSSARQRLGRRNRHHRLRRAQRPAGGVRRVHPRARRRSARDLRRRAGGAGPTASPPHERTDGGGGGTVIQVMTNEMFMPKPRRQEIRHPRAKKATAASGLSHYLDRRSEILFLSRRFPANLSFGRCVFQ